MRWRASTAWTRRRWTRRSTCARSRRAPLPPEFERIEAYYDAAPRSAARTEEIGPFTLFIGEGPWPYYARPRLGGEGGYFTPQAVEAVRARQRELGLPESFEWVHEVTPALIDVVHAAGLEALAAPLMVMEEFAAPAHDPRVRLLEPDDPALAASRAVLDVAFGAAGTAVGPEGAAERDAALQPALDFLRDRLRRRLTVTAVAETDDGVAAAGSHQPVGDVTEVVGVGTLPAARRQGLGAAVTGALVADALEHGTEIVFLSAGSDVIARVYGRLGFRRIGTAYIVG